MTFYEKLSLNNSTRLQYSPIYANYGIICNPNSMMLSCIIFGIQVCEEQQCEDQVFPLAANFMDRFLCICKISRQQLQLLGATCLLVASKIRQCHPLQVDLLCAYTDNSITPTELRVSFSQFINRKKKQPVFNSSFKSGNFD